MNMPFLCVAVALFAAVFDFEGASKVRFDQDAGAPNLMKAPAAWRCMTKDEFVHMEFTPVLGTVKVDDARMGGLKGGQDASNLHAYWRRTVMLPDSTGGVYRISCRYRSNHTNGKARFYAYCFVQPQILKAGTKNPENVGKWKAFQFTDTGEDSDYWIDWSNAFEVPAGTDRLEFNCRFMGTGYFKFTDFKLRRDTEEKTSDVSFLIKPYGLLDRRFAIEAGKAGAVMVTWTKDRNFRGVEWWRNWVAINVPKGFEFLGTTLDEPEKPHRAASRVKHPDGSATVIVPMSPKQPIPGGYHDNWGFGVLVRSTGAVGTEGELKLRALDADRQPMGEPGRITLFTVEPFSVTMPKRYLAGAMLAYDTENFRSSMAAQRAYAEYLRDKGVNWLMPITSILKSMPSVMDMWRGLGFKYITTTDHGYLMNAYKIRSDQERPERDRFVPRPGMSNRDFEHSACPASVYEERGFFKNDVMPFLARRSEGADGQWVNWEPYYFRGCYCDYCKTRGEEWMAKTGDGNVEHFHSWQHGQLALTVHRWMKRLFKPGTVGLMPAICWAEVGSYARLNDYPQDKLSKDYVGGLDWLPAWGPYLGWDQSSPYRPVKSLVEYYFAAKDVMEEMTRLYGAKRPKLIGQPAGCNYMLEPDWLEISMDAYFFNGWESVTPWIFPYGADARHWKAFAKHVSRAAKYEDFVFDGRRNDTVTTVRYLEGTAKCAAPNRDYLPAIRNVDNVQTVTWDLGGRRIVAVMNFDTERPAKVEVRFSDRPECGRIVALAPSSTEILEL